jgi:hypothetical protein
VRRVPAYLLLALFAGSMLGPALFAGADSQLPSCCRRDGMHHCAMSGAMDNESSSGPAFRPIHQKCPCFPATTVAPAHSNIVFLKAPAAAFACLQTHAAVQTQTEARYRVSFSRSRQKRGPPSLFS